MESGNANLTTNTPTSGYVPRAGDTVVASDGTKDVTGRVDSVGNGNFKMNGTTFPTSSIRKFSKGTNLLRELVDEVIEEMTSTGAVAGYMTPNAFRGGKSKKKAAERSMPGGTVVGDEDTDDTTIGEEAERLNLINRGAVMEEGRSRFRNFKESDMMKNHAKISYGIREAKKMLGEIEYLVNICDRLKTEAGITRNDLWKRTKPDMAEIHRRMKSIARKINKMGK